MRKRDAAVLARELMDNHGLGAWRFAFDRAKKRLGLCSHQRRTIFLAGPLVELNDEDRIRDTILHEVAHALVGPSHGHDRTWKLKCLEIGANPSCTVDVDELTMPRAPFVRICPNCRQISKYMHRRTTARRACASCCTKHAGGRFDERFLLVIEPNTDDEEALAQS